MRRVWRRYENGPTLSVVLRRALIVLAISLLAAGPASAGTIIVKLGLTPGKLAVAAVPASLGAGATSTISVKVADGRGTGAGWTLALDASTPVTITGITARCAAGSTCTLPKVADTAGILQAARDSGMGVIQLLVTVAPLRSGSAGAPLAFSVS